MAPAWTASVAKAGLFVWSVIAVSLLVGFWSHEPQFNLIGPDVVNREVVQIIAHEAKSLLPPT